ncbi:Arp [Pyrenophora teres f. teres]|uniref:Arp n=1 Tax=Pyrenophora teres f. teres TaxID=97479 RepID=A0A6S6W3S6_9PLEO|nr:Arp [Pyrenophora teres f. teres]
MIDALDECSHRSDLMKIIEAVAGWELQNMHLIVTSRRERDIESSLEGLVDPQNEICLQSEDFDKDIQQYIRQRLSDDKGLSKWGRDIMMRQEIETAIWKGSKGMFRWAVCQLDTLGKCRNKAMLRTALATLPSTLDKTYERILASISEEDTEYAIRILRWLAFSERPLSLDELAEVIAIDVARDPAFNPNEVLEDPLEALDICSSLVTILTEDLYDEQIIEDCIKDPSRPGSKIVILSHYSVKEYLVSKRISRSQTPQHSMQVEDFPGHRTYGRKSQYQLARYSARYWASHIHRSEHLSASTNSSALRLLSKDNTAYMIWNRIRTSCIILRSSEQDCEAIIGDTNDLIYQASSLGLKDVVKLLLDQDININGGHGDLGNALVEACGLRHKAIVTLLLNHGADPNSEHDGRTALGEAVYMGQKEIVKLLLDRGAAVNEGDGYSSALESASSLGDKEMVTVLLDRGAPVNNTDGNSQPLILAIMCGYREIVSLLIARGAAIDSEGRNSLQIFLGYGGSLIEIALGIDQGEIVALLLERGAAVNASDGYSTAPWLALKKGNKVIAGLLLANGAKLRPDDDIGMDSLCATYGDSDSS